MLNQVASKENERQFKLKWIVIVVGILALAVYLLSGIGLIFIFTFLLAMGLGGPGNHILGLLLSLLIFGIIAALYILPVLGLVIFFSKKKYGTALLIAIFMLIPGIYITKIFLSSDISPFHGNPLSGALVFPEGAFPENYERSVIGGGTSITYIDKSRKRITPPQIHYSYDQSGTSCKPDKNYQKVECSPAGVPGECFKDIRTSQYSEGDYDSPKFQIKDGNSCVSISFRDEAYSPEQMIGLINSMKREE